MEKVEVKSSETQNKTDEKSEAASPVEKQLTTLTALKYNWAIWEHWQGVEVKAVKGQSVEDYKSNLKSIAGFDNIVFFWQLWNHLPHADPGNFFVYYDESKEKCLQALYCSTT